MAEEESIETVLSEAERQVLIAHIEVEEPAETPNNNHYQFRPHTLDQAANYFCGLRTDWTVAYRSLLASGMLCEHDSGHYMLTGVGQQVARNERRQHPPIWYWYREFYPIVAASDVYGRFCERLYGRDLRQLGFSDQAQIDRLVTVGELATRTRILEIGCGLGFVGEYLSDRCGASVLGIDNTPEAVTLALQRTTAKRDRVTYAMGDLNHLDHLDHLDQVTPQPEPGTFDIIVSIDSLYFADDLASTLLALRSFLAPGGRMLVGYSCFAFDPDQPRTHLSADGNPLALALRAVGLRYTTWDLTEDMFHLMRRKHQLAKDMRDQFEAEGSGRLLTHLLTESDGDTTPYDPATCGTSRFLYRIDV